MSTLLLVWFGAFLFSQGVLLGIVLGHWSIIRKVSKTNHISFQSACSMVYVLLTEKQPYQSISGDSAISHTTQTDHHY